MHSFGSEFSPWILIGYRCLLKGQQFIKTNVHKTVKTNRQHELAHRTGPWARLVRGQVNMRLSSTFRERGGVQCRWDVSEPGQTEGRVFPAARRQR